MTKQEILDAINATIAPNGQKGITAESLANILTEIVNAAGEGGGGGGVVFYMGAAEMSGSSPIFTLTAEQKTHNAAQFQIVKNSPVALIGGIDISTMFPEEAALGVKQSYPLDSLQYIPYEMAVEGGYETDVILFSIQDILDSVHLVVLPDGSIETVSE